MRWYNIVSGILLILSILDVALAAPVLVQEKRQASVDVVHIPKGVITGWWKRGPADKELEKLAEEYLKTSGKSVESSDAHASSSSALPGPDHGSTNVVQASVPDPGAHASSSSALPVPSYEPTNVVQAPAPNPASSTADPNPLTNPSSPSSMSFESSALSDSDDYEWSSESEDGDEVHKPLYAPTSAGHGLDHEPISALPGFEHGLTNVVQEPAPNPALSTANPDPLMKLSSSDSSKEEEEETLSDAEYKWLLMLQGNYRPHKKLLYNPPFVMSSDEEALVPPRPGKRPWTNPDGPGPDPDFDWDHWSLEDPPSKKPALSKEFSQAKPGPLADPDFDWDYWRKVEDPPSKRPALSKGFWGSTSQSEPGPLADPDFDWDYWRKVEDPSKRPGSSKESGQDDEPVLSPMPASAVHPPSMGAGLPTEPAHEVAGPSSTNLGSPIPFEYGVANRPPPSPELTDPGLHLDHQSLSGDPQLADLLAAIYAARGKAKQSRRISGTTRDVGNAA